MELAAGQRSITVHFAWSPVASAIKYRLCRRDPERNKTLWVGPESSCVLSLAPVDQGGEYRVEAIIGAASDYVTVVPFVRPNEEADSPARLWLRTRDELQSQPRSSFSSLFMAQLEGQDGQPYKLLIDYLAISGRRVRFLSHSLPSAEQPQGVLVAGDTERPSLLHSADLGETWRALPLGSQLRSSVVRHFLTRSGTHIVQTANPVETVSFDNRGMFVGRANLGGLLWHGSWSIDESEAGTVIFAEYRDTAENIGGEICVWRTSDEGRSWSKVLSVSGRSKEDGSEIRHFHTCQADPYMAGRWYVTSGDRSHECGLWVSEDDGVTWQRVQPDVSSSSRVEPAHWPRLLRMTACAIRPDYMVWATDDNVNHGVSTLVRLRKDKPCLYAVDTLSVNLMRSFVQIEGKQSIAISEAKDFVGSASVYLIEDDLHASARVALDNRFRRSTGFSYSIASRRAAGGTFFSGSDGNVLTGDRKGFLRWKLEPQRRDPKMSRLRPAAAFARWRGRRVEWFPENYEVKENDLVVFFHAQRTGGTSFQDLLARVYGPRALYTRTMLKGEYRHWAQLTEADLAPYRVYAGHTFFSEKDLDRRQLYLSIVRHPVERLVSLYRLVRGSMEFPDLNKLANELDIERWVRHIYEKRDTKYVSNLQTHFVCGAADADYAIDLASRRYFGLCVAEHREAFTRRVARALKWPVAEQKHLNAASTPRDVEVTPAFEKFVRDINSEDWKLYEFALDVWRQAR